MMSTQQESKTTIAIYTKEWRKINKRREPRQSFAETVRKLIELVEVYESEMQLQK